MPGGKFTSRGRLPFRLWKANPVVSNKMEGTHLTHTEGIIGTFDCQEGVACAHPVFKALGNVPTLITPRRKAKQRKKALAGQPKPDLLWARYAGRTEKLRAGSAT